MDSAFVMGQMIWHRSTENTKGEFADCCILAFTQRSYLHFKFKFRSTERNSGLHYLHRLSYRWCTYCCLQRRNSLPHRYHTRLPQNSRCHQLREVTFQGWLLPICLVDALYSIFWGWLLNEPFWLAPSWYNTYWQIACLQYKLCPFIYYSHVSHFRSKRYLFGKVFFVWQSEILDSISRVDFCFTFVVLFWSFILCLIEYQSSHVYQKKTPSGGSCLWKPHIFTQWSYGADNIHLHVWLTKQVHRKIILYSRCLWDRKVGADL